MKKHLLTLNCLLATATLYAAPYPRLDPNSLINGTPKPSWVAKFRGNTRGKCRSW